MQQAPNTHISDLAALSIPAIPRPDSLLRWHDRDDPHLCNFAFPQNNLKLVASIPLEGQPNKICGTSDHFNVNFCPKQALAELAQAMFDYFPWWCIAPYCLFF